MVAAFKFREPYLDINAVCNGTAGLCSGVLGGNDISGWSWASVDDVNALFKTYNYNPFIQMGPGPDFYNEYHLTGSPTFFSLFPSHGWIVSFESSVPSPAIDVQGWTRTVFPLGQPYAYLGAIYEMPGAPVQTSAVTNWGNCIPSPPSDIGGWFYRTDVPSPATLPLLGLGLAALGYSRWKRFKS